jgi:SAM-dependent methyltransferase
MEENQCPLCSNHKVSLKLAKPTGQRYFDCHTCGLIFLGAEFLLKPETEKACYLNHKNDVEDLGYQKFVSPIIDYVSKNISLNSQGLDFGAGPGPVVTSMLRKLGYDMTMYDPFFWDDKLALDRSYDFIVASEVAEHFHSPAKELLKLKAILKDEGQLILMTEIFDDQIDFAKWYYHLDSTHVVFYRSESLEWIRSHFGFKDLLKIHKRIAVLTT